VARAELPSGTVTFLFTDIEGSTRLLHELGKGYAEVLAEHRRVLREAFARHGGVEVDTQGDAFFVVFARASDAVGGAQEAQLALRGGRVRVRMGLHTGEPILGEEGYVGFDVHRGARVAAAGHGGQVLLSQPTRDLLDSSFELVDLGLHRLKDLSEPQLLYQLGTEEFPPLKTLYQTNLPVPATPFLGRERGIAEILGLLRSSRLVTLTGAGGSGKTRLALQAAAEAAEDFPAGVWWVPLATLRDPELVLDSISKALGAQGALTAHIADKELLLVLDNLEQLLAAAPELATLLESCSGLRLLATSREPLRVAAEQEYPVLPFASAEAVEFFSARARTFKPDFERSFAVAEICRRLDNLPLALELAAARVKVLSPGQLLARLERALPLLTDGRRDAPERQQTLEATIAWSYELLTEPEQRFFARLSVFAGGCTVEAAENVCAAELETLASLVDKSLLRQSEERFWMLETIREFALERLGEREPSGDVYGRYVEYLLAGAEANYGVLFDPPTQGQLDWFESEHDNLRAALDWLQESRAASELELRLAAACVKFWIHRGNWTEARRRVEGALERADAAPAWLRARVLEAAAEFAWTQGEYERAKEFAEAALALYDELGTSGSEPLAPRLSLAVCEERLGNPERAVEIFESVAAMARAIGDERMVAFALSGHANLALDRRDFKRARALLEESVAIDRGPNGESRLANDLVDLGFVAFAEGRPDEAAVSFREGLSICRTERIAHTLIWAVEGIAAIALVRDAPTVATRLLAATGQARAEHAFAEGYYSIADEVRERTLAVAHENLGEAAFALAWAEGRGLSIEEAADAAALVD
jgi:predicted ATPase/class 3 adenylate cyclase